MFLEGQTRETLYACIQILPRETLYACIQIPPRETLYTCIQILPRETLYACIQILPRAIKRNFAVSQLCLLLTPSFCILHEDQASMKRKSKTASISISMKQQGAISRPLHGHNMHHSTRPTHRVLCRALAHHTSAVINGHFDRTLEILFAHVWKQNLKEENQKR